MVVHRDSPPQVRSHAHAHPLAHAHAHSHPHSAHSHAHRPPPGGARRLSLTLALVLVYMLAEGIGGWLTNSLALLADAGHMLSDAAALGLALFAMWFARRPATSRHTYGFHRTEILAALVNGASLIAIALLIAIEAVQRFAAPAEVQAPWMMAIAGGGLLVNLASLWLLGGHRHDSLNLRGAWLHVLTDALGSVQAILAGAAIWAFGWAWADPLASLLIGALVVYSAWGLLRDSVAVLMERAPGHIDVDQVRNSMLAQDGVVSVHDLHVWTIKSGMESLSAHVVVVDERARGAVLTAIRGTLHARFGIDHVTVQIEPERCGTGVCDEQPTVP